MSKSAEIAVVLRLRDQMGGQAAKALDTLTRAARGVGQGAGAAARELGRLDRSGQGVRSVGIAAAATDKLMGGLGRTALKASRDVAAVGQAAGAVKSVGTQAHEALRGLDQAARAGNRLRDALRGVGTAGQAALGLVKGVGQAGAGLAAGAGVAAASLRQPISFEKRMTLMANTAYADETDVSKRLGGVKQLTDAVNESVRAGGGNRDEAADALEAMLASNVVKQDDARRLLPIIQQYATSSGSKSTDIADIVIGGLQYKKFSVDEVSLALDKALVSGQAGGFELKDMAKWLRKMFAMSSGMSGMKGYEEILAYAQAAVSTAGSKDEAGNNLVNLLQKISSHETQDQFQKKGIDLTGSLIRAREKNMLPLEAFTELMDRELISKNKRYRGLRQKLGAAQGEEKKQVLNDMADLAAASVFGEILPDRQALLSALAGYTQRDYIKNIKGKMANASGEGDRSFATYKATTAYSTEHLANEAEIARSNMLGDVSGPIKAAADGAAELAQRFPTLATVAAEAATSIGVMSAAAAAFGAMRLFTGGAGGAAAAAAAGAAGGGGLAGMLGGKGGILATAGLAAWDIYATESNDALTRAQKNTQHTANAGGLAAAIAGMKLGAMAGAGLGSVVPGLGTGIGGIVGGLAGGAMGWWSGSRAGRFAGEQLWGPSGQAVTDAQKVVVEDKSTLHVESVLHIDGREVARAVNTYNTAEAKRE